MSQCTPAALFAQCWNRLTTLFSECVPVTKWHLPVLACPCLGCGGREKIFPESSQALSHASQNPHFLCSGPKTLSQKFSLFKRPWLSHTPGGVQHKHQPSNFHRQSFKKYKLRIKKTQNAQVNKSLKARQSRKKRAAGVDPQRLQILELLDTKYKILHLL